MNWVQQLGLAFVGATAVTGVLLVYRVGTVAGVTVAILGLILGLVKFVVGGEMS